MTLGLQTAVSTPTKAKSNVTRGEERVHVTCVSTILSATALHFRLKFYESVKLISKLLSSHNAKCLICQSCCFLSTAPVKSESFAAMSIVVNNLKIEKNAFTWCKKIMTCASPVLSHFYRKRPQSQHVFLIDALASDPPIRRLCALSAAKN